MLDPKIWHRARSHKKNSMKDKFRVAVVTTTRAAVTIRRLIMTKLSALWALHTEGLRTRSSYRAEGVALVIGIVGLLSVQPPLDFAVIAAVSAYVAHYASSHGARDGDAGW